MLHRFWPLLILMFPLLGAAAVPHSSLNPSSFEERERPLRQPLIRDSQFGTVPHIAERPNCEQVQPPQALTTPDPLWIPARDGAGVKVSFIVGTDGRVHSPLILQSAGARGDHRVLQAVRSWRFRPATCNGVPTEMEDKVGFSSR